MPSWDLYKKMHGAGTVGRGFLRNSDIVMEETWDTDPQSRVAYVYDMYHDSDPRRLTDMQSDRDKEKIPLPVKLIKHTSQTMDKDVITYHLQMKPSQECNVPYFRQYEEMYGSEWPLGLYCDIPDAKGVFKRWMVVAEANINDVSFPTWEVLRCDNTYQYVLKGKKCEVAGVSRSQNSYNSKCYVMQECINENRVKSVKVSRRKHRGKARIAERPWLTVERRG